MFVFTFYDKAIGSRTTIICSESMATGFGVCFQSHLTQVAVYFHTEADGAI